MATKDKKTPADHVVEKDGIADVALSRPAIIAGATVSSIRMREPTVADMEAFQDSKESEATREIMTLSNLCEIAPDNLRKLPVRDYARLQAAFALFTI